MSAPTGVSTARSSSPCRANWTRVGGASSRARSPSECAPGSGCPIRSPSTGGGVDGENPHAHLMFSERGNDGIARTAEQWFKRYNAKEPEQGGARKSRAAKAGDWLATTRQTWEQTANRALGQAGREARIDHRSLADRRDAARRDGDLDRAAELSREPNVHLGPSRHRAGGGAAARESVGKRGASSRRTRRTPPSGTRPVGRWRAWSGRSPRSGRG